MTKTAQYPRIAPPAFGMCKAIKPFLASWASNIREEIKKPRRNKNARNANRIMVSAASINNAGGRGRSTGRALLEGGGGRGGEGKGVRTI